MHNNRRMLVKQILLAAMIFSFVLHVKEDHLTLENMQRTNVRPATKKPRNIKEIQMIIMQCMETCLCNHLKDFNNHIHLIIMKAILG
jgi:hypothetical protein